MSKLGRAGFTLLETLIAVSIMMVAFAAILMVESASINTTIKAKQLNVVSMLAKNMLVESEHKFEGKPFEELKQEESGNFAPPYEDYRWKRTVKELTFPSISAGGNKDSDTEEGDASASAETLTKLVTNHLSKAIREVTVTVTWKKGRGEQSFSASTYWVDLNHAFQLSE